MAQVNVNVVVVTGNLTKDPELRTTANGTSVCKLRIAVNTRRKDPSSGEWVDRPNYFDVTVWGGQGEAAARYLSKGRPVAVDGRLEWREWEAEGGGRRQAVEIVSRDLQFLNAGQSGNGASAEVERDASTAQPAPAGVPDGADGDDLPF
jgi:single-strand DNA-binding protein